MENKTITKQIEEIVEEFCNNYCKYSEMSCYEHEEQLYIQCENCPFNRL